MNNDNEQYLYNKYPKIFPKINQNGNEFPLECGDGWLQIVDDLCQDIQAMVDEGDCSQVIAMQVKEKFGGLRFYTQGGDEKIYPLIGKAEDKSYTTCEYCGSPEGKERKGGWIKTLCDACVRV